MLDHLLRGHLTDDEAGAAAQPPDLLEHGGVDIHECLTMLGAGIEYRDLQTPKCRNVFEQRVGLIVEAQIRQLDHRLSAFGGKFIGDALQPLLLACHQNHQVACPRESARGRLAEAVSDPCNERERSRAHVAAC